MATVRKRGNTFTITASLGYREDGSHIRKYTTYTPPPGVTQGKAAKLAKEYAVLWEGQIRGYVPLDENKTLKELTDWYFETQAPALNRPNVVYKKKSALYLHIVPELGNIKIKHITPQMLDAHFAKLKQTGLSELAYKLKDRSLFDGIKRSEFAAKAGIRRERLFELLRGEAVRRDNADKVAEALGLPFDKVFDEARPTRELAASTVRTIKLNLSSIFTQAAKKQIIKQNPCQFVTLPKVEIEPAEYLDEDQSRALLDALHAQGNFQVETITNLFLASGMRAGELLALHWEDINFETAVVHIRHTLVRLKGEFILQDAKTLKSRRRIKLPTYIISLLIEHKKQQEARIANCPGVFIHNGAIFTNETGGYLHTATIRGQIKRIIKAAGLEGVNLHGLRHTHASLLINSDVAAKVVADRLGHADTRTTLNIYTHIFEETEAKALQAVEMKLFQRDGEAAHNDEGRLQ